MNRKQYVFLTIALVLLAYITLCYGISQHELTHAKIFAYYGCDERLIEITDYGFSGTTNCAHNMTKSAIDKMYDLHMQNEIVFHNTTPIIVTLFICTFVIISCIAIKGHD